jgi:small subunit ribosomal protein S3
LGRKVHPLGFRLGIIKDWQARWFATGEEYADLLQEDMDIRQTIRDEMGQAGISKIEIERFPKRVSLTIWTAKPGIIIGRKGVNVRALRQNVEALSNKKVRIDVQEVERPELDAYLVAENIASQLQRRISHSRAMKRAASQTMRMGAEGIKISCSGRLTGAEMARREWVMEGRVPRNTLRADIDYGFSEARTTYGRIGIKVWIYKGEILPEVAEAAAS